MNAPPSDTIDFGETIRKLPNKQVWEYELGSKRTCHDVGEETFAALQTPLEFPPLGAAIVRGDHAALAVDANVASVAGVVEGAVRALDQAGAGEIDVVVCDESSESTVSTILGCVGDRARVTRHDPSHREALRYLGADEAADPIYLSRWLVDADFVLPISAERALEPATEIDLTGVFPSFSDSRARNRRLQISSTDIDPKDPAAATDFAEPAWLLGVQIMVSVAANNRGLASQIVAGTPDAIGKRRTPTRRQPDEFPPSAPLVVASLDGDSQQQSWTNAARAANAAKRYALPGATIVLWTAISQTPSRSKLETALDRGEDGEMTVAQDIDIGEEFPAWSFDETASQSLARVAEEHRLLIHSRLSPETIESLGLAAIDSEEQLLKLSQSYDSCGVLRAAQFAGTTIDSSHPFP